MKRIAFLFFLVGGMAFSTFPEVREALGPPLRPLMERLDLGLQMAVEASANAVFRWSVERELQSILRAFEERAAAGEPIPEPRGFQEFLRGERALGGIDPWGKPYFMEVTEDSVILGSGGPDLIPGTEDDLRVGREHFYP